MQLSLAFCSAYKSLNHRVNFGQFKLCTDVEKNPGHSVYVDATKNNSCSILSRKRCSFLGNYWTTMCCNESLRFNLREMRRITSVDDMIQIVIVGNQLYSSLSLLARQSMLMLTELPGMVTVFERFFQL